MLVDMSHAVGAYLVDVFVTRLDWWVVLGIVAQGLFTMRFMVQWIASERAGHSVIPTGVLDFFHRRRPAASGLCALPQGCGVYRRPGVRRLRLSAQSLFRLARSQSDQRRSRQNLALRRAASAAKPRSRSAIRSSTASSPMWKRTVGRPAPSASRCATACSRTEWRGSHSRPTRRRCRTIRACRGRRNRPSAAPA